MNVFVFHLVSGDAFLTGNAMLVAALLGIASGRMVVQRLASLCGIFGLLLMVMTAVPGNGLYYFAGAGLGISWMIWRFHFRSSRRFGTIFIVVVIAFVSLSLANELSGRRRPDFDEPAPRTLVIFADSLTAGISENEAITWPNLLSRKHSIRVIDYSRMGATVGSELKRLDELALVDGVILIELGGNDVLGATSVPDFERSLNEFLSQVTASHQTVVMFELPVPPTFNRFGSVQRRLARRYSVQLIPKRELAKILASPENTLDTIHLSQPGHEQMARSVWDQISFAFQPVP
ncbi:SGNH/GDSL hydrolase family protein [Thalassoglobus polymorphus]|uniref:Arylesterase n=1 Tax=Thalassoglobus polymorphus TaxID=2527994 RepID=A0A517QPC4_9PLAN|nr:GDSL-type esterase/lipase family protein [Thalassoglobus polymorphus]QDT33471.1 Arylesterase precursor [Thalassoglobus polymorphus]